MSSTQYHQWQKLFLFSLGLFIAAAFCMKWMEPDLVYQGKTFSVVGLEISYPKEKISELFSGLDAPVKKILTYHLYFDFLFMPGVFLGILALCKMAALKTKPGLLRNILNTLAYLQLLAWGLDITENAFLLTWLKNPVIGSEFTLFHVAVYTKWILALAGALVSIPVVLFKKQKK